MDNYTDTDPFHSEQVDDEEKVSKGGGGLGFSNTYLASQP